MKIRTGFVSNSSSSSFLVLLDERPKNTDHLIKLVFSEQIYKGEKREVYDKIYDPYMDHTENLVEGKNVFSTRVVAEYLGIPDDRHTCQLSQANKRCVVNFIAEALLSGAVEDKTLMVGYPPYPDTSYDTVEERRDADKKFLEYRKAETKWANSHAKFLAEMLIAQYEGKCLCRFEASDDEGNLGSTVEHGDTFKNCPFWLRFSQH